jgi:hypothetical protein
MGCVSTSVTQTPDSSQLSIANEQSVDILGKTFERQFKAHDKEVQIYEYFLAQETPDYWFERIEFQVYPEHADGNKPIDFAERAAAAFKKEHPDMLFALNPDSNTDAVFLDYFYPTTAHKEKGMGFLEFNAFMFFREVGSPFVVSIHYVKIIEGMSPYRRMSEVENDITKAREEIIQAMTRFPLVRQ